MPNAQCSSTILGSTGRVTSTRRPTYFKTATPALSVRRRFMRFHLILFVRKVMPYFFSRRQHQYCLGRACISFSPCSSCTCGSPVIPVPRSVKATELPPSPYTLELSVAWTSLAILERARAYFSELFEIGPMIEHSGSPARRISGHLPDRRAQEAGPLHQCFHTLGVDSTGGRARVLAYIARWSAMIVYVAGGCLCYSGSLPIVFLFQHR